MDNRRSHPVSVLDAASLAVSELLPVKQVAVAPSDIAKFVEAWNSDTSREHFARKDRIYAKSSPVPAISRIQRACRCVVSRAVRTDAEHDELMESLFDIHAGVTDEDEAMSLAWIFVEELEAHYKNAKEGRRDAYFQKIMKAKK